MALTQIQQAMLADGILTADAAGRLKMADGFVNAAKLGAGAARANWGAGGVLQIVSLSKTDTYGTNTAGWNDITGLAATITPSLASSKILVLGNVSCGQDTSNLFSLRMLRNGTLIDAGDASGGSAQGLGNVGQRETNAMTVFPITFLDSPATTSACTYKIQVATESGYAFYLNRTAGNLGDLRAGRTASNIILLEIAG